MPPPQTASHHSQPLKPIYKHPLNPSSTKNLLKPALTPAPPPKTRQGDPQWLRIMHTKENQWRLINTIALHELNLLERSACNQLDSLAEKLDALITQTAHLDNLVAKCRLIRASQSFVNMAAPPLQRAIRIMHRLQYPAVANAVLDNRSALDVPDQLGSSDLARFRDAANKFADAARFHNLYDLADVADELELLASVAAKEPPAVACAAQAVVEAANASERARLEIVDSVVDSHTNGFVPEPSFVE